MFKNLLFLNFLPFFYGIGTNFKDFVHSSKFRKSIEDSHIGEVLIFVTLFTNFTSAQFQIDDEIISFRS